MTAEKRLLRSQSAPLPSQTDLSNLHQPQNNPFEKITETNTNKAVSPVSKKELYAARIGFFTGGFTVASWAPLIPFVQSELALTPMVLGTLLLGLGVGSFVGMPLAGGLSRRIGAKNAILFSGLASCLLLILLAWMPSFAFECMALFLYGITLGCLEVSVNIYGTYLEKRNGARLMSGLHAAYSIGEVVSAAMITTLFILGVTPLATILVLMVALSLALGYLMHGIANVKIGKTDKKESGFRFTITKPIAIIALLCATIFLTEGAMLDWSAIYLRDNAGVAQEASALGYTLFVIAMALSRLIGDRLTTRYGPVTILSLGISIILLSLIVLIVAPIPVIAYASLFMMGFGIANLAPILISAASRTNSMDGVKAITAVTTVGYGGLLLGPALIGTISSAISLQGAFAGICFLLMLALALVAKDRNIYR